MYNDVKSLYSISFMFCVFIRLYITVQDRGFYLGAGVDFVKGGGGSRQSLKVLTVEVKSFLTYFAILLLKVGLK